MKGLTLAVSAVSAILLASPALAQGYGRNSDPNLGHFYMARQQIQILDDVPVVYDKRSAPAQANPQSGLPQGPAPLPRAGFNSYSSALPTGMGAGLPQVVNGVPRKIPQSSNPTQVQANRAKAGAYKPKSGATPRPSSPAVAKTYAPYQGYGAPNSVGSSGPTPGNSTYGQSSVKSSTGVKGNLLHWSRSRPSY
jgi:hypothetical protein